MAKTAYKIPTSLDRSFLDHEVSLVGGGWQAKALPMKVILFWAVSVLVLFWVLSSTFVKSADLILVLGVILWWFVATAFFGQYSKTKEMKFTSVPALLQYVPAPARRVTTRRSSNPSGFYSILRIESIDESGFVKWLDGTVGQFYLVVGSASVLLFEEDRQAILDRVDAFWRKFDTNVEVVMLTTKESQRVHRQMANLERLNLALRDRHPELFDLMDERHSILRDYVGGQFSSIHQYIVLKGDNAEALRRAHTVLNAEVDASTLMIKQCTVLDRDSAYAMLRSVYTSIRSTSG